jgi:hypothetical protein
LLATGPPAIVTEWNEFRNPDFEVMARLLRQPVIFDGRNLYDPARMAALVFTYQGIGRAPAFRPNAEHLGRDGGGIGDGRSWRGDTIPRIPVLRSPEVRATPR